MIHLENEANCSGLDFDAAHYARKPPFPWFGGKSKAASAVWGALGDVEHYVEPFAGGLAVLLNRPHACNRPYYSETVNDLDGFIVNAWRAIAADPDAVAEAASWPVTEADKTARQIALLRWRDEYAAEKLAGSADWYDAKMAGWWLWAVAAQIGAFDGRGAWTVCRETGRIMKMPRERSSSGVARDLPHLANDGHGINGPQLREPGVVRDLPHLTSNGQGVNDARVREPGVARNLPDLINNGRGVNDARIREPGVVRDTHGREVTEDDFHPITMPKLRWWMRLLCARMRHVRILNGQWYRVCTQGTLRTLSVRTGGMCGVFLDPPYTEEVRAMGLYAAESGNIAHDVREWCKRMGNEPWLRIVLAGYDGEHDDLLAHGWRKIEWYEHDGMLAGGMSKRGHLERLWLSPHCLHKEEAACEQLSLFSYRTAS